MTNYEHYKEEIEKYTRLLIPFALDIKTKEIKRCNDILCKDCAFLRDNFHCDNPCDVNKIKWADEEYCEPEIDWTKVAVDTPIHVSRNGKDWQNCYFAKYENGKVYAWNYGGTSWTRATTGYTAWNYAKLAETEHKEERTKNNQASPCLK